MTRADQLKAIFPGILLVVLSVGGACAVVGGGGGSGVLALSRYVIDGGAVLLWTASAAGLGGAVVRRLRWGRGEAGFHPALRLGLSLGLGWGALSLAQLGLGLAGRIGAGWAWGMLVPGWAAGAWALARRSAGEQGTSADGGGPARVPWAVLALAPMAITVLYLAIIPAGFLWKGEPNAYDVLAYHLQLPREWYELGRIVPLTHNVFSFMPLALEMHSLAAMQLMGGAWAGMYAAQMMHAAFFAAAALAAYGAFAPMGRAAAVLAGLAILGCPYVLLLAPIAYNEGGVVLYGVLVLALLVRKDVSLAGAAVAGACAGFAAGVKLTAVPLWIVAPAVMLAVLPGGWRRIAPFLIAAALAFSPWLVRTAVWTHGNPVFPLMADALGAAHFTPEQVARFNAAHAPRPDQQAIDARLDEFWRQVLSAREFGFLLIPLAVASAAFAFACRYRLALAVLLLFHCVVWLFATHLQGRFFVPTLPVLVFLIARSRLRWAAVPVAIYGLMFLWTRPEISDVPAGLPGIDLESPQVQGLFPSAAATKDLPPEQVLTLVGDGTPYLYFRPTRVLKYTSAFDAVGADALRAWRAAPGDALWIDPGELERLSRTYHTPGPLPEWKGRDPFRVLR